MFLVVQESGVGQGVLPSSMLKDVFDSACGAHNHAGIFMLSVSSKQPIFNIVPSHR